MVTEAVFSVVYTASDRSLAASWWPGSTGVVDFSQRTRKLRAGGQASLVLDFVSPAAPRRLAQLLLGESAQFQRTDTATFLLTVRLLQDQYSHVSLKAFNRRDHDRNI